MKKTDLNPVYVLIRPPSLEALVRSVSFVALLLKLFSVKNKKKNSNLYSISSIRCHGYYF